LYHIRGPTLLEKSVKWLNLARWQFGMGIPLTFFYLEETLAVLAGMVEILAP